jgi:hypothetical protein
MSFSPLSPSLPPELADPIVQLRAKLLEINDSEQTCMTDAVASASQGKRLPVVQAVIARCRQTAAAAAATAINAFCRECSEIGASQLVGQGSNRCCRRQNRLGLLDQVRELRRCLLV